MKTIDDLLNLKDVKAEFERQANDNQREKFFNFLLRRMATRHEAEQWLIDKNVAPERAELMLYDAEQANLINDNFYAKEFITGHDTWGRRRISFELERRGISNHDISAAFDELEELEGLEEPENYGFESENKSEREKIIPLLSSYIDSGLDIHDRKDLNKIKSRLYRRGFADRDIRAALEELPPSRLPF